MFITRPLLIWKYFLTRGNIYLPKDIFYSVLQNKQYWILLAIAFLYYVNWVIIINLGLVLNRVKLRNPLGILLAAIPGVSYSLFGKLLIPEFLSFFVVVLIYTLTLFILARISIIKAFLNALFVFITSTIGLLLIGQPILVTQLKHVFSKPEGAIVGSIFEAIVPLVLLFIFKRIDQKKRELPRTNSLRFIPYIVIMFVVYYLFLILFYTVSNYYKPDTISILQILIGEWLLLCLTVFILFRLTKLFTKEQQIREEDHSAYLLRTILSKQREYRNFFQVIRALAERGKTKEIVDYIDDIHAEMSVVETFNEENPIFTSLLVAEQIKAREKGITITNQTKTALSELKEPVEVYDIFKDLLQYIVAYEERINSEEHLLNIEVDEDEQHYSFIILRQLEVRPESLEPRVEGGPLDDDQTLKQIKKRIKELHGKFYFLYRDNELVGCLFKVGKARRKQFPFFFGL